MTGNVERGLSARTRRTFEQRLDRFESRLQAGKLLNKSQLEQVDAMRRFLYEATPGEPGSKVPIRDPNIGDLVKRVALAETYQGGLQYQRTLDSFHAKQDAIDRKLKSTNISEEERSELEAEARSLARMLYYLER